MRFDRKAKKAHALAPRLDCWQAHCVVHGVFSMHVFLCARNFQVRTASIWSSRDELLAYQRALEFEASVRERADTMSTVPVIDATSIADSLLALVHDAATGGLGWPDPADARLCSRSQPRGCGRGYKRLLPTHTLGARTGSVL